MTRYLLAVLTVLFSVTSFSAPTRYYLVPNSNLELFPIEERPLIEGTEHGLSLVKLTQKQVEDFAEQSHKKLHVCGGFTDAQVLMEKRGIPPESVLRWALSRPYVLHRFPALAPSHPAEVEKVMSMTNVTRFGQFLTELTSFPDRSATTDLGLKAAQFLSTRSLSLAQSHNRNEITARMISAGSAYKQTSVIVRIPGTDPKLPGVLIGGHMDTFSDNKPGADDDGSGTTSVMEIYQAVLDSNIKFKRDLYFAYYAAEERGLYGSQAMAAEFQSRKIPMRAILQFDMTGFKSPNDTQELYLITDHVDTNLTQFLRSLAETYLKIPTNMIGETRCGYACSDHASWTNAGYSAAFPFEATFQNYNKTLHTARDTMTLLKPDHAMKFVKLGAAFAVETADPN